MHPLGIERLSVFGLPPPPFLALAAELGCDSIGLGLARGDTNPHGYPDWSLRDDPALLRETRAAAADTGVAIALVEGFAVIPGRDIADYAPDLDIVAALGAPRVAVVSLDQDLGRTIAGYAAFAALCATRGLLASAELGSLGPVRRIADARAVWDAVGAANFSILLDAMHVFRLGSTADDVATLPAAAIGYVQLCDAPWQQRFATYIEEAMYERMVPGEGELPLAAFLAALPPGVPVSLEIPQRALAETGIPPRDRLAPCVAAARRLLASVQQHR